METKKLTKRQMSAIMYLTKGYTVRRVAEILHIGVSKIRGWMENNDRFKEVLEKRLEDGNDKDAEYRKRNNSYYLEKIYDAIHTRIKDPVVLSDMELKELFSISKILATEVRLDSSVNNKTKEPVENTSFNTLIITDSVKDRYLERGSVNKLLSKNQKIIEAEILKEDNNESEEERLH